MALKHILRRVAAVAGFTSYEEDARERNLLLDLINEGATELWNSTDLPGSLREVTAKVFSNKIASLPTFVGSVRAFRETTCQWPWKLSDMRPKYHYNNWEQDWRNFRLLAEKAIARDVTNQAPVTLTVPTANNEITVTMVGPTADSSRVSDAVIMDATTKTGTKSFSDVQKISSNIPTVEDITVLDANGAELAILYSSYIETAYQQVDVSEFPNFVECPDGTFLVDVLFNLRLPYLYYDDDIFPVPGYDHIIARKALQLAYEEQDGKEERAVFFHNKAELLVEQKQQHEERTIHARAHFHPRPLLGLYRHGRRMGRKANRHFYDSY